VAKLDGRTELLQDGLDRISEASRFLAVSRSTLYALLASGALPSTTIGRSRRVPHRAVVELAAKGLVNRTSADSGAHPGRGRGA
jgi:excisionase family DNA binding protein